MSVLKAINNIPQNKLNRFGFSIICLGFFLSGYQFLTNGYLDEMPMMFEKMSIIPENGYRDLFMPFIFFGWIVGFIGGVRGTRREFKQKSKGI